MRSQYQTKISNKTCNFTTTTRKNQASNSSSQKTMNHTETRQFIFEFCNRTISSKEESKLTNTRRENWQSFPWPPGECLLGILFSPSLLDSKTSESVLLVGLHSFHRLIALQARSDQLPSLRIHKLSSRASGHASVTLQTLLSPV